MTAYYNIRKREGNQFEDQAYCSFDRYLKFGAQLMAQPIRLVIFVEQELADWAREARKGKESSTLIVIRELEKLSLYSFKDRFIENDRLNHPVNLDPRKFTPLLSLLVNSKPEFVSEIMNLNPFNTNYFAWIDFRALDLSPVGPDFFTRAVPEQLGDYIRLNLMSYWHKDEIGNKKEYYRAIRGIISGTMWIGSKTVLEKFIEYYRTELKWCLDNGVAPTEEQVIGYLTTVHPTLFNFYAGEYVNSLNAYDGVMGHQHLALKSMQKAFDRSQHTVTQQMAINLLAGVKKGRINLDPSDLYRCYYFLYVALYWLNQREEAKKICHEMLERTELRNEIVGRRQFLLDNLSYLQDSSLIEKINSYNTDEIAIVGWLPSKDEKGLQLMGLSYRRVNSVDEANQAGGSIIMLPSHYIAPSAFPNKKIIYGPHHWIWTEGPLTENDAECYDHSVYNTISPWINDEEFSSLRCRKVNLPFPVDVEKFIPGAGERTEVLCYSKQRHPFCLEYLKPVLNSYKVNYITQEQDYIETLKRCRWGIWIGGSDSQGSELEEVLSMDIPLLVWDVSSAHQSFVDGKFLSHRSDLITKPLKATSAPYWDERCGWKVKSGDEVLAYLPIFEQRVKSNVYHPRDYIMETLSPAMCRQRWLDAMKEL